MKPYARDWHRIAFEKLTRVMGEREGVSIADSVLAELALTHIDSASDLRRVAAALSARGGFEAAVGGLLAVHATMYGDLHEPS